MSFLADLRDELDFILFAWLKEEDRDTGTALLDLSEKLADRAFAPYHRLADLQEPELADGEVCVLPQARDALAQYQEMGLFGASFDPEYGGMGLNQVMSSASFALFAAANLSFSAYAMLTVANARLLTAFGSLAQIDQFARPEIEGRWFGTMCLSEPNAGSSLADIKTRALSDGEDSLGPRHRIFGQKMWISGAGQDISENIVHLVLAKAVDEHGAVKAGTAGISLFVVPRFLPDGAANDVAIAGLNHKLGYRGIPNCAVNFGEGIEQPGGAAGAIGWRIGEEGDGLRQMFKMMNEARIGVSLGAAAVGYRAFRQALRYASERVQGRGVAGAENVPIIAHPDVQRMLLQQKSYSEGALALTLYAARLSDRDDEALLSLLTPIVKSWASAWTLKANDLAIQIHGGYGYTRDFDVELLWRDNRLNPIHEGTNGIQAIDLLDRKILRGNGEAMRELRVRIGMTMKRAENDHLLAALVPPLQQAWSDLEAAIRKLCKAKREDMLFNASPFLDAMGHIVVAWLLLDQLLVAPDVDPARMANKRRSCAMFFASELPMVRSWVGAVTSTPAGSAEPDQY